MGAAVDEVAVLWKLLLFWKQMGLVECAAVSESSCDIFSFAVFRAVVLSVHAVVVVGTAIQFFVSLLQQSKNIIH